MKLFTILNSIKNKDRASNPMLSARNGKSFEDLLQERLTEDSTYINVSKKRFWEFYNKNEKAFIKNLLLNFAQDEKNISHPLFLRSAKDRKIIIKEPFGSQSYPDFLLIKGGGVLPIECKYSKKNTNHPVWNSSLPRHGGIYIFGAYGLNDVAFFKGEEYITPEKRIALKEIFDYAEIKQKELSPKKDGTFSTFLRRMYNQDFNSFSKPDRDRIELSTLSSISEW